MRVASVIVDIATRSLDGAFTYSVPTDCASVQVGCAVLVGFGKLRAVSVRAEGTFGRLRCSFGGDRPRQTARLRLSAASLRLSVEFQ